MTMTINNKCKTEIKKWVLNLRSGVKSDKFSVWYKQIEKLKIFNT